MLRYNYFNIFLLHQFLYFKLKTKTRKIFGVQNILFAAIWIHTLVQWSVDVNCMVRKESSEWVADCASSLYRSDHVPLRCSGQHWQPLCNGAAQLQGNVTILYRLTQTIMKVLNSYFLLVFHFRYTSTNTRTSKAVGWTCSESAVTCVRRVSKESGPSG